MLTVFLCWPVAQGKEGNNCIPTFNDTWEVFFSPLSYTWKWCVTRVKEPLRYREVCNPDQLNLQQLLPMKARGRDLKSSLSSIPCVEEGIGLNRAMDLSKLARSVVFINPPCWFTSHWNHLVTQPPLSHTNPSASNGDTLFDPGLTNFLYSQVQGSDVSPWCLQTWGELILLPICWDCRETQCKLWWKSFGFEKKIYLFFSQINCLWLFYTRRLFRAYISWNFKRKYGHRCSYCL